MRRNSMILAVLCLGILLLAGCGNNTDGSSLSVNKNGNVTARVVEQFDMQLYSADELKQYVNDAIAEYTAANGENTVKLDSLSVKKGTAVMVITYESYQDYNAFNGSNIFVGTVEEAIRAGYTFDGNFVTIEGKHCMLCGADEFLMKADSYVVVADEAFYVELPYKISYASREDVSYVDGKRAALRKHADILFPEEEEKFGRKSDVEETPELEIIYTHLSEEGTESEEITSQEPETNETFDFEDTEVDESMMVYMICNQ